MIRLIVILAVLALAGCASTRVDPGYAAYLDANRAAQQQEAVTRQGIADSAAACAGDSTCVVAVAGFAAMAAQSGSRGQSIQPYQRQPGAFERITLGVVSALPGLGQIYATVDAGRRSVEIAQIGANREIGIAGAWAGALTSTAGSFAGVTSDVAQAFGALPPSTYVGGDLISGTQHIGDATSIGRDAIGGDQHVGDNIARDTIGGDRINDSNIGSDNRIGSPGPYDNDTDNSGQCTGELCQGSGLPPTDPDDPGAPIAGPRP